MVVLLAGVLVRHAAATTRLPPTQLCEYAGGAREPRMSSHPGPDRPCSLFLVRGRAPCHSVAICRFLPREFTLESRKETRKMNRDDADSVEDTEIVVEVVPTTGGSFEIKLDATATVEELRWRVARKVQTPRERLTLLSRERLDRRPTVQAYCIYRVLKTGRLDELEIRDGSRITLIPQLEAGFSVSQSHFAIARAADLLNT
jgi:hypothetical protein